MLLKNKKVAIIGAGPVGLTMARLLQQKGVDVTVYERDKDAQTRISGGTLDLHKSSGQEAFQKAGLLQHYFAIARPMGRTVADQHGKVMLTRKVTVEEQYDNPEINRNDLRNLLLNSLSKDTVVWNRKATDLEEHDGKWLLHFETGTTAFADFVIGANGGMSKVRRHVTDAEVESTGTYMLQGEVSNPEANCKGFYELCSNNVLMIAGNGNLLVANPKNNNVLTYNVIFRKPLDWVDENGLKIQEKENIVSFLLDRFSDWHAHYQQLFRSTSSFVGLETRKLPLDKPWKNDRSLPVTLIGDAAHLMPPFAGQGVNTGLMDAMILSDNLTNGKFETTQEAINDYEQKMFVYATEAQRETDQNERAMFRSDFSFEKFYQ